jgi:hypothetical protein
MKWKSDVYTSCICVVGDVGGDTGDTLLSCPDPTIPAVLSMIVLESSRSRPQATLPSSGMFCKISNLRVFGFVWFVHILINLNTIEGFCSFDKRKHLNETESTQYSEVSTSCKCLKLFN